MVRATVETHDCDLEDGVLGHGNLDAEICFIGIAPGKDEWERTKRPFTGGAGRILDGTLSVCGRLTRDDVFTTNLICWWQDSPTPSEIERCWPRLRSEISMMQARNLKVIVLCGAIVTEVFAQHLPGGKSFTQLRGGVYWSTVFECWLLVVNHPAAFLYEDSHVDIADFARDIAKLRWVPSWPQDIAEVTYHVIEDENVAADILWSLEEHTAIDVEATYDGLTSLYEQERPAAYPEWQEGKLLCLSVSTGRQTWTIPGDVAQRSTAKRPGWGSNPAVKWSMHLGMFDKNQLRGFLGEELELFDDTLLMSYSLDERGGKTENEFDRAVGIHDLGTLSREYLGAGFYKENILQLSVDELHDRNAMDANYTARLRDHFEILQVEQNVRDSFYRTLLMPATNVLSEVQARGAWIDHRVISDFACEIIPMWIETHDELVKEAQEVYGWPGRINLGSSQQIIKFVYDYLGAPPRYHRKTGRLTTDREAMEELADEIPWCGKLKHWRNLDHIQSSYVQGIEDDIKADGCVHAEPLLHGARSGRMSYHKPPVQTIPNKGVDPWLAALRRMFAARSREYVIMSADYKQAEFWATYFESRDEALLEELESGDIHGEVAKLIFGVDETYEHFGILRFLTKVTNFGILYGRQAQGFVDSMWRGHQPPPAVQAGLIKWDFAAARDFIKKWELRHPGVVKWRNEEIRKAMREGEQRTRTGRVRRYWRPTHKVLTQSVNFVPQSLAHDHILDSLIKLHPLLAKFDSYILFEVHDAIVFEVRREYVDEVGRLIKRVMEEPKFGLERGIPIDLEVGPNWYDMEKVKVVV